MGLAMPETLVVAYEYSRLSIFPHFSACASEFYDACTSCVLNMANEKSGSISKGDKHLFCP
jgi:hypothetical protein